MAEVDELAVNSFVVPPQHPALAGHFPGNPLVPGVVILRQVIGAAVQLGYAVRAVANVKFSAMLLPGEQADIKLQEKGVGKGLGFAVTRGEVILASGQLDVVREGHDG